MNHNCNDHLTLASYKWDKENYKIKYIYMCKKCKKTFESETDLELIDLTQMLSNEIYNKYNL
jgi:hypothetical protein